MTRIWGHAISRKADDFVFATRNGTPTERRKVLRHLKAAARELNLSKRIDFRSFRTMHASLMRRSGARPEIARDNMGRAEIPTTLEIYSKTWWEERATAVSAVVDMVMNSNEREDSDSKLPEQGSPRMLFQPETRNS
jgi:site-specific recombinase XerD